MQPSFLIGPPVGGALYTRFGFRGPCIFGIITAFLDLVARLIVIERKDALMWGYDPLALPDQGPESNANDTEAAPNQLQVQEVPETKEAPSAPLFVVIIKLAKSSRAITASLLAFVYASVSNQSPLVPDTEMHVVWRTPQ